MFAEYLFRLSSAEYESHILLIDTDDLEAKTKFSEYYAKHSFQIIRYVDDLWFRVLYTDALMDNDRYLVIARSDDYIPYDIYKKFRCMDISLAKLFPKLNAIVLKAEPELNYDLLAMAYQENFADLQSREATQNFLRNVVCNQENVKNYLGHMVMAFQQLSEQAETYKDWFEIATQKAFIDVMAVAHNTDAPTEHVHVLFRKFILDKYGTLSQELNRNAPVLVSKAMEYMHDNSEKFAVVVMDGMSEFDWRLLSRTFTGLKYRKADSFAMIPTTTSVSRQCLLSGKYPVQLSNPWSQSKEKAEFFDCAKQLGYTDEQIAYERGYDSDLPMAVKCAAFIINDIDDLVHAQRQGRHGMYNDVSYLAGKCKLAGLASRLLQHGFDVYITADHGNTPCIGSGKLVGTGVETETKSRRMVVLKTIANKKTLMHQHLMLEYPKYYLDKRYDYLICEAGSSLDASGEEVMSHGGITLDEVIVPFVILKAKDNND